MEFSNKNKNNQEDEVSAPTVDDLVPVLNEFEKRLAAVENALRHHEHNAAGQTVIRL